jgi:ribose transport system substrate-binding protein
VKARLFLGAGLFALSFACGCGKGAAPHGAPPSPATGPAAAPAPGTPARGTIGLSVLTLANPFFKIIADTMTVEAAKHGYRVQTVAGDFDVAKQKDQVADFIVNRVSAIVLTPCNSKSIGTSIAEANKAGIPVFTADIACLAEGATVVTHVATDNYGGGRLAAKALIEALHGTGKVAIVDHPEVESVLLRTKGFRDELEEAKKNRGVTMEIVITVPGGGVKDKSFKATEDVLQAVPELDGIFAINDPSAMGALAAVEKAGRASKIVIVGFDGEVEACQAIKEGKIYADVVQHPAQIAQETVGAIVAYMNGEDVKREILIPVTLYRQADTATDPRLAAPPR